MYNKNENPVRKSGESKNKATRTLTTPNGRENQLTTRGAIISTGDTRMNATISQFDWGFFFASWYLRQRSILISPSGIFDEE
jgi:hypothetical protein